jgi:hypothetical protein
VELGLVEVLVAVLGKHRPDAGPEAESADGVAAAARVCERAVALAARCLLAMGECGGEGGGGCLQRMHTMGTGAALERLSAQLGAAEAGGGGALQAVRALAALLARRPPALVRSP